MSVELLKFTVEDRCTSGAVVFTLQHLVTDRRSCSALWVRVWRFNPSVFKHHWRIWSVYFSLWPQHKQLHPQINKTGGSGHEGSRTASKKSDSRRVSAASFGEARVCVYMCVNTTAPMSNWRCVEECGADLHRCGRGSRPINVKISFPDVIAHDPLLTNPKGFSCSALLKGLHNWRRYRVRGGGC